MTLVEFLTARLKEDEAWAGNPECDQDPDRVLREVGAKRRIVKRVADDAAYDAPAHKVQAMSRDEWYLVRTARDVLQYLALPYVDHPDFQPEWHVT